MKTHLSIWFILIAFAKLLWSQPGASPDLRVTFPAQNDTIPFDKVRIAGYAQPGSRVLVNDKVVRVYPHGAFVTRVPLLKNFNTIVITAFKNGQTAEEILSVYRPPETTVPPAIPTQIVDDMLEPVSDLWLMAGDYLNLRFKGSPSGRASFSIEDLFKNMPMTELVRNDSKLIPGIYNGVAKIPFTVTNKALRIKYELKGLDGKKVSAQAEGRLYILPEKIPIVGLVKEATYMHSSAKSYSPMTRLAESIRVHVVGKKQDRYKIKLADSKFAFVDAKSIKILPLGTPLPIAAVSAPSISNNAHWWQFSMSIDYAIPFTTRHNLETKTVELLLYGAYPNSNWTTLPNYETEIKRFSVKTSADGTLTISISMDQSTLWGHKVEFKNGRLLFSIRKTPSFPNSTSSPLQGICIAIDPGHGGDNEGTLSPIGLLEKDINLQWAFRLRSKLAADEAQVFLTRSEDEDVSLEERLRRAIAKEALIFISLHNNSTTPNGNPISARGTGTFFTLEQNKELAFAIYPHMLRLGLPPYGRIKNSYYVTNSPEMLVVLIEGLFMSNPEEESLLLKEGFIDRMADAVYNGIYDFMNSKRQLTQR